MGDIPVGEVVNYFPKIGVAAIEITEASLKIGDNIKIKGATTDFSQIVQSMQINKENVEEAEIGSSVGIKVNDKVRPGDRVYKISD